jgi:hypothetical protein
MSARRSVWRVPVAVLLSMALATAQGLPPDKPLVKDEDEVAKLGPVDPYTGNDAAVMAQAGIVAYGPFPWADFFSTTDVDKVLGEKRVLWLETTHFKLGCNLRSEGWPAQPNERKALQDEIKLLRKKLPKVPERPKKLDPWLRLHLYAQRCERAYADFQALLGVTDADFPAKGKLPREGAFLGLPGKFLVLLFQKQSDMARYMDRFTGRKDDTSMRTYHDKTHQMLFCVAADGFEGIDDPGLHGHVVHAVWNNLLNGYNGFSFPLPLWLTEGVAHCYARKIETEFLNVQIKDDEAVAEDKQSNWPVKVRRRTQHEKLCIPFATMAQWSKWEDMGYHAHAQSWSRVDYLLQLDRQKVGELVRQLKAVPPDGTWDGQGPKIRALAEKLVFDLFGLDQATFDQKWRDWVLKTYPKK